MSCERKFGLEKIVSLVAVSAIALAISFGPAHTKGKQSLKNLTDDEAACPDGSYLRLDPLGTGEWQCLSRSDMKKALGVLSKTIFVTSGTYDGDLVSAANNLGAVPVFDPSVQGEGRKAGDFICNSLAADALFQPPNQTNFVAWLSDSENPATNQIRAPAGPYVLVNGQKVSDNLNAMIDIFGEVGELEFSILEDEFGNFDSRFEHRVWTGTLIDGFASGFDCSDWTATTDSGTAGSRLSRFSSWTEGDFAISCESEARLYCFEK